MASFIKNSAQIQKLQINNQAGRLLKFFSLTLQTKPNFGKHPILQKAASVYDTEATNGLGDIGMQLERDAQTARDKANQEILEQMRNCKNEFLELAEADWARLCYKTSKHNILDQGYMVRLKPQAKVMQELDEMDDEDEDDYDEADNSQKDSRVVTDDDNLCVLSTFL